MCALEVWLHSLTGQSKRILSEQLMLVIARIRKQNSPTYWVFLSFGRESCVLLCYLGHAQGQNEQDGLRDRAGKQILDFRAAAAALFAFATFLDFYFHSMHSSSLINILDENVKTSEMAGCYYSWSCWHFPVAEWQPQLLVILRNPPGISMRVGSEKLPSFLYLFIYL